MAGVLCVTQFIPAVEGGSNNLSLWIDKIPEVLFTIQCNTKHSTTTTLLHY